MRIYRGKDYNDAGRIAGNILGAQVVTKPDCVLGLATGSTPISAYDRMVDMYEEGTVDIQLHPNVILVADEAALGDNF